MAFAPGLTKILYKSVLRRALFLVEAERVHNWAIWTGRFLGKFKFTRSLIKFCFDYRHSALKQNILGINFENPLGLAAGFDKNGYLIGILSSLGFGFTELGSVSGEFCAGNKKPRIWRLPKAKALQVNYGMPNEGCNKVYSRLSTEEFSIPLGVNIAKTNIPKFDGLTEGIGDYLKAYKAMQELGDYFTVNISCPSTIGGRPFEQPENFRQLIEVLNPCIASKPLFVKLSPDLPQYQLSQILDIALEFGVNGFICSNLSKERIKQLQPKNPRGGVSGKPIEDSVNNQIKFVYKKVKDRAMVIGCGGVFSAEDAYKKIRLGASLIQLITGMIYEGPQLIGEINRGLVKLLQKDGYRSISEAIGIDNK